MMARSFMNTAIVNIFMLQLRAAKFKSVPKSVEDNLQTGFSLTETLVIENSIKAIRTAESRNQDNRQVALVRRWITPIARKIPDNVFKYKQLDFKKVVLRSPALKRKRLL